MTNTPDELCILYPARRLERIKDMLNAGDTTFALQEIEKMIQGSESVHWTEDGDSLYEIDDDLEETFSGKVGAVCRYRVAIALPDIFLVTTSAKSEGYGHDFKYRIFETADDAEKFAETVEQESEK
jgi:hypothetical protein